MSRIEVRYTTCPANPSLVGGTRWINPITGVLYDNPSDTLQCSQGFQERTTVGGVRSWGRSNGTVVTQTIEVHLPVTGYPDGNPKSAQGAKKYDLMYLPLPAKIEVNRALEDGAKKYGKANWRETGVSATVYLNAAMRHIDQYNEGQERASDSTVHNLGHAMACLAIIIDAAANGKLIDDRPTPCVDTDKLLLR